MALAKEVAREAEAALGTARAEAGRGGGGGGGGGGGRGERGGGEGGTLQVITPKNRFGSLEDLDAQPGTEL